MFISGCSVLVWLIRKLPQTAFLMIIAGAIIGIGYGSVTPILQTQIISSVEKHRIGIANSLFFNSMDLGMAVGAFVLGIVAKFFGYSSVFLSGIALIALGGFAYFILASGRAAIKVQLPNTLNRDGIVWRKEH
jgi:predicted MFS family arabinose efflux permease